jgi:hypothetical protein
MQFLCKGKMISSSQCLHTTTTNTKLATQLHQKSTNTGSSIHRQERQYGRSTNNKTKPDTYGGGGIVHPQKDKMNECNFQLF